MLGLCFASIKPSMLVYYIIKELLNKLEYRNKRI